MKLKFALLLINSPHFDGYRAVVCNVSSKGRLEKSGIYIEITSKEIFGEDAGKEGFRMAGLDDLIKAKIIESKRYNSKFTEEDIEICNADFYARSSI